MDKDTFIRRILDLDSELKLAIHLDEYDKIESLSIRIGKLIQKYIHIKIRSIYGLMRCNANLFLKFIPFNSIL
jgi:hypothetical protein